MWHYGNAFDDVDAVVVGFSRWSSFTLGADPGRTGAFTRMRLPPGSGTAALTHLDESMSEFARIDDRLCGQAHHYVTVSRKSGKHEGLLNGEFDRLVRYDAETGESVHYDGDLVHGEVVHAARAGGSVGRGDVELDGWYLTYATDLAARSSASSSGRRRPCRPSRWPRSEGLTACPTVSTGTGCPPSPEPPSGDHPPLPECRRSASTVRRRFPGSSPRRHAAATPRYDADAGRVTWG